MEVCWREIDHKTYQSQVFNFYVLLKFNCESSQINETAYAHIKREELMTGKRRCELLFEREFVGWCTSCLCVWLIRFWSTNFFFLPVDTGLMTVKLP